MTLNRRRKADTQLLEAELALSDKPADRLAAYEKEWEWRYVAEQFVEGQFRVGRTAVRL